MKKKHIYLFIMAFFFLTSASFAQGVIKGKIIDAGNKETLVGATIILDGTTIGTIAELDGTFTLNAPAGDYTVKISFVGFADQQKTVSVQDGRTVDLGTIALETNSIGLNEISVLADVAIARKTPVAVSSVSAQIIERELGNQEFPEIMKMTPGVYATKNGGGFGDGRINVRGFNQRNVAVLINGIPVNDMENGWVYWSNWAGLSDATRTMQVQRGLGASKLAINSVGGTLNIITRTTDAKKGGFIKTSTTDYGMKKTMLGLNTGLMENGWALSFIGSRTSGEGYMDATWIDAWSYFLSASKQLNEDHQIVFTAIGAPQKHGQVVSNKYHALSIAEYKKYGNKWNKGWGYLDGKAMNEKTNYYHKPQIALNWYWNISDKSFLSTSAYVSFGRGGGSGILGKGYYKYNVNKSPYGWYDWNQSVEANEASTTGAQQILRNSVNSHNWFGILSTYNTELKENVKLMAGIDGRKYKGIHHREIRDLLGAEYWDDSYAPYKSGIAQAVIGDKIDYYNDGHVSYLGLFSQIEYAKNDVSAFVAASVSNTWYRRVDYFNYDNQYATLRDDYEGVESTTEKQLGYNFKTGFNYNINENHNVFVNAGFYARAPFFDFVFINYSNDVNEEYTTEKILAGEIGYGYNSRYFTARINAYYTKWYDRWLDGRYRDADGKSKSVLFKDLDEIHYGIEAELQANITKDLKIGVQASIGNWYYGNDVDIDVYDENQQLDGSFRSYTKDLKVADAPQTQLGMAVKWQITPQLDFGLNRVFYASLYAKFDPEERTDEAKAGINSYKLPSYGVTDVRLGYSFKVGDLDAYASWNVYNLFNTEYIAEGWDGNSHDEDTFVGFWGWGRNMNFSLRINF